MKANGIKFVNLTEVSPDDMKVAKANGLTVFFLRFGIGRFVVGKRKDVAIAAEILGCDFYQA